MTKTNIIQERWDYLIILDACRYDFFKKAYRQYLKGDLSKKISMGSCTDQWRNNTFTGYYDDIVYISANPRISSDIAVTDFKASDHFHKVHDVWKAGWDQERGTVLPETLTNRTFEIIGDTKDKRVIIHYLQPHAPYLGFGNGLSGFIDPDTNMSKVLLGINIEERQAKIRMSLVKYFVELIRKHRVLQGFLGDHPEWMLRQLFFLPPKTPMDAVRRKFGRKGLVRAYRENLDIVLKEVSRLVKHLSGRIVITADHGEMLGENLCYTHGHDSDKPQLIEIPWLVIDKLSVDDDVSKTRSQEQTGDDNSLDDQKISQEQIDERLRALGYMD